MEVVGEAADGAAGIEVARAEIPDLVVLDLSMPVMDGLEARPHIRASCPAAAVVVAGLGADRMAQRALAAGADGYLQKGTPIADVVAYLGGAVGMAVAMVVACAIDRREGEGARGRGGEGSGTR